MPTVKLTLAVLHAVFAVCRFEPYEPIPAWSLQGFFAVTRTDDELSIVCPQANVPLEIRKTGVEGEWRCFKVEGPLAFALTDVLLAIAAPLAAAGISIFAISTYKTDYVLVKQHALEQAIQTLAQAGHRVIEEADHAAS